MSGPCAWSLTPIKRLAAGKSRLARCYAPEQRRSLQLAMLSDGLASLGAARRIVGRAVLTADPEAAALARRCGAVVLEDCAPEGDLNEALRRGVEALARFSPQSVLLAPADLPLLNPRDIDLLVETADWNDGFAIAPDRRWDGTNGLVFPGARPPRFRFGPGSFEGHRRQPDGQGCAAAALSSFALDIDEPADLTALAGRLDGGRGDALNTTAWLRAARPAMEESLR